MSLPHVKHDSCMDSYVHTLFEAVFNWSQSRVQQQNPC